MAKKIENIYDCLKSRLVLDQIADKWSILILGTLKNGPARFNQLKRTLEGVSQKSLTQCLRKLERSGLIERTILDGATLGVEYALSEVGESISEPFEALFLWISKNAAKIEKAQTKFDETRVKKPRI